MKTKILGVQKVDYTSKKTGLPVDGVTFHIERKDGYVVGSCCEQIFVKTAQLENFGVNLQPENYKAALGHQLEAEYNNKGFLVSLAITA